MTRRATTSRPPPSLANKLTRAVWLSVYHTLFKFSPIPAHAWRRVLLRVFGANVGRKVMVYPSCRIWAPWNVELQDYATIGAGSDLYAVDKISVGKSAIISQRAYICTATHDLDSPNFDLCTAEIRVGDNAWVATEAFLAPGVQIGDGAVVGARAVVTHDVEPNSVVAGNPARFVRERAVKGRNKLGNQT